MATKTLIVDYSWSGTTAKLAAALQHVTGGDRVDLTVAAETFPNDMYATSDVANQQLTTQQLPALTNALPDVNAYDVLLVGGPVWSAKVSTPVRSFLQQLTNFQGTVAPFYTDAGTPGGYEDDFASLVTTATVVPGIGLTAGELRDAEQQLTSWWQNLIK
ncbi:flavodoxin family protein [Levilactobacillus suantsaiihabitans]|uniref:Flavodoxin n=1 Tax=Levilactobacillus suantsaiihabitans TaxID=2487722 RepID=A0A4Z0J701_9LACO|nr:flavodoxin [Levilactobacillus suantsaiihabitans]TGD18361.1 flavodoxin [Levilactobacillus suantsaiihabitans]